MKGFRKLLLFVPNLLHRLFWKRIGEKWDQQLAKKFRLFHPGTQAELETMVDAYRCRQIGIVVLFLLAALLAVFFVGSRGSASSSAIRIWRNGYGEGERQEEVVLDNGETVTFTVADREYGKEELDQAFSEAFAWIRDTMLLENSEAGLVRSNLNFMTEIPGGFCAEWISSAPDILNHDGEVFNKEWIEETRQYVKVQLILSWEEQIRSQELEFCIREPDYSVKDRAILKIKKQIMEKEQASREEESFLIPGVIEGISLKQEGENRNYGIVLLGGALFVFFFFYQRNRMEEEGKDRYLQLEEDYPILINKLVLYLGAGINLRKTFQQIASEYAEDIQAGRVEKRYMYEELTVMVNEMNAGAGEQKAYEDFGYRMEHNSYTKLISLLVQNLQKGNEGLLNALRAEEANAFFLRIDYAKKKAEQAGTKLLFPMLLMLLIVMALVMAPALFQFGSI